MKILALFLSLSFAVSPICAQNLIGSFTENFNVSTAPANFTFGSGGENRQTWQNGVESETEEETRVMRLTLHPDNAAGPWQGPNFNSGLTLFGRYSARIKIPDVSSQPNVGAVVGFYTYYNDDWSSGQEPDINENGMTDNSEIDFEWLVAHPQLIYLTAWTDFNQDGVCKKISRIVNMATGHILTTNYSERLGGASVPLTGAENRPETIRAIPNFDASANFYTYGFDWKSDNIRWWILNPEDENDTLVLWDYRGNAQVGNSRITQKPAYLMFNVWHTNDWPAEGRPGSVQAPTRTFYTDFDWIKYEKLEERQEPNPDPPEPVSLTPKNVGKGSGDRSIIGGFFAGRLNLNVAAAGYYTISVFGLDGKLLAQTKANLASGANALLIGENLAKGTKIVRVEGAGVKVVRKVSTGKL